MPNADNGFKVACAKYRAMGAANATGDALRAMHAKLIAGIHGGDAQVYFRHLNRPTDEEIKSEANKLLHNRGEAWGALLNAGPA